MPKFQMIEKESDIVRACMEYLTLKGIFHYRNNTGAKSMSYKKKSGEIKNYYVKFGIRGAPDIIVVIEGQFIGVEVKSKNGEQSFDQCEFQVKLEKAGGRYLLIHSVEELIESL